MRDRDDRALVFLQEVLEPADRLGVEVVCRLVEQQQIRRLQQQPAERDAAPLAARELGHVGVRRRQTQRVHRVLELRVEVPRAGGVDRVLHARLLVEDLVHLLGRELLAELRVDLVEARQQRARARDAFLDVAEHVLRLVELRLLRQEADREAGRERRLALIFGVEPRHDAQQRRLARAVRSDDADLRAIQKGEPDVLEY